MGTVTIGANNYTVYGDLPSAKIYLAGSVGAGPDAWNASADDAAKSKVMVAAKRYLDEMLWQGAKTVPSQSDAWPRSGVLDYTGTAVDSASVPTNVINAEYELAAIFMVNSAANDAANSGSNVKRVNAKGVEVEFFGATNVPGRASKMPTVVQRLVGQYLQSAIGNSAAAKYYNSDELGTDVDTCKDSSFDNDAIQDFVGPFG